MATKVRIDAKGFTDKQLDKLNRAGELLERVINSQVFQDEVLNFSYQYYTGALWWKSWHTSNAFRWNNGDSNAEVLKKFLDGKELKTEKDNEIDVLITIEVMDSGVLGYTNPDTLKTWISKAFFNEAELHEIAGNLAHEYCHKRGYDHEFNPTALRDYTVPYAVGYITDRVAKELLLRDQPEQRLALSRGESVSFA
jgi:hypothetical protein